MIDLWQAFTGRACYSSGRKRLGYRSRTGGGMNRRIRKTLIALALCGVAAGSLDRSRAEEPSEYLGPCDVLASKDARRLLVLEADAGQVAVVDAAGRVTGTIHMPATPTGLVLSPDGATLYVTCARPEGTVAVVDLPSGKVTATIPVGHSPTGPAVSPDGKRLYVCNRFSGNVSVIDVGTAPGESLRAIYEESARVPTGREPIASALTPDGKLLFVANHLPADRADQEGLAAVAATVTVIDTETCEPSAIRLTTGSSGVRGVCVSPDGKHAYVPHVLARYHLPTKQLEKGWMNTNALSIIDVAAKQLINTVLLDAPLEGAANPWGVAASPDGKSICISHAGTHELSVIDARGLFNRLMAMPQVGYSNAHVYGEPYYDYEYGEYPPSSSADVPNDLAFLKGIRRRIKLKGKGPRGLAIVGSEAYVAEYFTDTLAVVDLAAEGDQRVDSIALGPKPVLTLRRKGQMYFHDAALCFQRWQSCASCHPDARMDGLNWDLLNDGTTNPKNTRSMLLAHQTPPAMASGVRANAEAAVRSGIEHIQFTRRPEADAVAIDEYLKSLQPVPSPHLVAGQLSPAALRGKALFFSERIGCAECHPPPLYTDMLMHDVGSQRPFDRRRDFDTPTLIEVWRTAPYMHDGHYTTIKELIVEGKHGNRDGSLDQLDDRQIDDLVEFVLSL